jgi:hypothetical protein
VPPATDRVRAVGRLVPDGRWIGFVATASGYRLVAAESDQPARQLTGATADEERAGLVAVAIVHFLASLEPPPPELEATHADIAQLVRGLASSSRAATGSEAAREAVDAIDDGLPGDAVALRLAALLPDPSADPVAILAGRLAASRRT